MKKTLAVLAVFLCAVFTGTAVIGISLYKTGHDVTFESVYEEGDRQLLEGITVQTNISHNGILSWATEFVPLTGKTETVIDFNKKGNSGPHMGNGGGLFFAYTDLFFLASESDRLKEHIETVKSTVTGDYEKVMLTFDMKEYFDYYPVVLSVTLPDISIEWEQDSPIQEFKGEYVTAGISQERAVGLVCAVEDFIRIPVLQNDIREYEIKKVEDSFSYASIVSGFQFSSSAVVVGDKCYFSFFNKNVTRQGKFADTVDTSLIPGGYGIYCISFSDGDVRYEDISNVYSIDPECSVTDIYYDSTNGYICVVLLDGGKYVVLAIDEKTKETVYRIELFEYTDDDYVNYYDYDSFSVFVKNSNDIKVLKKDGKNSETAFSVSIDEQGLIWHGAWNYPEMYFDGERLVIFSVDDGWTTLEGVQQRSCSLLAKVLTEEDGIVYSGKWHCSLGEGRYSSNNYWPFCNFSITKKPIVIK